MPPVRVFATFVEMSSSVAVSPVSIMSTATTGLRSPRQWQPAVCSRHLRVASVLELEIVPFGGERVERIANDLVGELNAGVVVHINHRRDVDRATLANRVDGSKDLMENLVIGGIW